MVRQRIAEHDEAASACRGKAAGNTPGLCRVIPGACLQRDSLAALLAAWLGASRRSGAHGTLLPRAFGNWTDKARLRPKPYVITQVTGEEPS